MKKPVIAGFFILKIKFAFYLFLRKLNFIQVQINFLISLLKQLKFIFFLFIIFCCNLDIRLIAVFECPRHNQ